MAQEACGPGRLHPDKDPAPCSGRVGHAAPAEQLPPRLCPGVAQRSVSRVPVVLSSAGSSTEWMNVDPHPHMYVSIVGIIPTDIIMGPELQRVGAGQGWSGGVRSAWKGQKRGGG